MDTVTRTPAVAETAELRLAETGDEEALRLLATAHLGRVSFTHQALPTIRLVNHLVDEGRIILRTRSGTALMQQALTGAIVAYQADELSPHSLEGWSVILTGVVTVVEDAELIERYRDSLVPWIDKQADRFLSIRPGVITGYRIVAAV
ncbi:pyridoxamine 5'-phosphate oxidase family protein [Streptomyces sp. NPDC048623]|uniref:pyridoxamine 5'-phosphate oxidase family protein n=1 Tax=Streptomyces sp. NPDC048623 TaxID=3155761 RepID=UPI0034438FF8